jgi:alpha-mannosidase
VHDDGALLIARLRRVLHERLVPRMYSMSVPLTVSAWHAPGEPVPFASAMAATFEPFAVGQPWGPPWGTTWFRFTGDVPPAWRGRRIEALIDLGFGPRRLGDGFQAEGLVYDADGAPVQGIHPRRAAVPVAASNSRVDLIVEAAANPMLGARHTPSTLGRLTTAGSAPLYRLQDASLALLDTAMFDLLLDFEIVGGLIDELHHNDPRRDQLLGATQRALDSIDLDDIGRTAPLATAALAPGVGGGGEGRD